MRLLEMKRKSEDEERERERASEPSGRENRDDSR